MQVSLGAPKPPPTQSTADDEYHSAPQQQLPMNIAPTAPIRLAPEPPTKESPPATSAPQPQPRQHPPPSQLQSSEPNASVPPPATGPTYNVFIHTELTNRRAEYKAAALEAKHAGDMPRAKQFYKYMKEFDAVIQALENGQVIMSDRRTTDLSLKEK